MAGRSLEAGFWGAAVVPWPSKRPVSLLHMATEVLDSVQTAPLAMPVVDLWGRKTLQPAVVQCISSAVVVGVNEPRAVEGFPSCGSSNG